MLLISAMVILSAAPLRVAIPSLSLSDVPADRGVALIDYLAQQLGQGGGLHITTPSEIQAVLGNERQQALLGCQEGSSCLAELSAALGAEYLVVGSVARVGGETVSTLKLVAASNGEVRRAWSKRAADETQLLDFFARTAEEMRGLLIPGEEPAPPRSRSPVRFLPIALGGVSFIAGVALFVHAFFQQQRLVKGDPSITSVERAESLAASGRSIEVTAYLLGGVGLALLAGGAAFAVLAPESDVSIGAAWVNGPVLAFQGALP
jgi:hypothetical protein